ncbi:MAG TPA: carbohydrate ABC transporter substrate-binding protein, partial [Propionicimonas sp.]
MKRRTGLVLVAAAASLTLALTACSGSPTTTSTAGGSASAAEPKTLTIWDYESDDSAMGQAWAKAVEIFKAKHPDVTVKEEAQTFEQIQKNAKIVLTGDSVPDVMEYNKGNATA